MLFNGGGIASVYAVGTVPAARGKGIGSAITLKPLLEARAMGYHYAGLFSTEMGIRTYQWIGFQLTDSRINRYLWRDE
jgi:ribosomal protein S18 acetylase RimI-like enzyme